MSILNPSPICLVNGLSTLNGVDVTDSSVVTVQLQDPAGVKQWNITCFSTDELNDKNIFTASLQSNINFTTFTTTFIAPIQGSSLILQSKINGGVDPNGIPQPSYTTTFKISVLTAGNKRVFAFDESIENNANFGWIPVLNDLIRNPSSGGGPSLGAGNGLFISLGDYNVGQNPDNTILVNADNIQLNPTFYSVAATAGTLVQRSSSGVVNANVFAGTGTSNFGSITVSGTSSLASLSATNTSVTTLTASGAGSFASLSTTGNITVGGNLNVTGTLTTSTLSLSTLTLAGELIFDTPLPGFNVRTVDNTSGDSKGMGLFTGQAIVLAGSASGGIILNTGLSSGPSGAIDIKTGQTTGTATRSGSIFLTTEANNALAGRTSGDIILFTKPTVATTNHGIISLHSSGAGISIGKSVTAASGASEFGGGKRVIFIANADQAPSTNPINGGILFVQNGALRYRGSNGTPTLIANA